jgi:hypothetical protein
MPSTSELQKQDYRQTIHKHLKEYKPIICIGTSRTVSLMTSKVMAAFDFAVNGDVGLQNFI